jgi:CRP/FNR family transcriptional regulator, cyclic AMP receptor protein
VSFRFRVVPQQKRRGAGQVKAKKVSRDVRSLENWFDGSSVKEQVSSDLCQDVRAQLEAISSRMAYAKGEVLFVEGQKSEGVFVLHSGSVKLSASSADGKSLIVGRVERREILGLPTAISGKPNELTAEALQPAECSFVARNIFLQFLREHGNAALRIAEILSHMYDAAFGQARYLGLSASAEEKLARLLLELPAPTPQDNGHSFPLTHKEIAETIGLSRETVSRMLARFKRANLIEPHSLGFRVVDRSRLEGLLKQI